MGEQSPQKATLWTTGQGRARPTATDDIDKNSLLWRSGLLLLYYPRKGMLCLRRTAA